MTRIEGKSAVRWPVKCFFVFHCLMVLTWSIPGAPVRLEQWSWRIPGTGYEIRPYRDYLGRTGLWQDWGMFAPDPPKVDIYLDQVVTFQNGEVKVHRYPRMATMPVWRRFFHERYRKFVDRVNPDSDRRKWPIFAQRIAYEEFTDPANPPVLVALRRHWKDIQPLGEVPWMDYRSATYFEHRVDQNRLRALKRW